MPDVINDDDRADNLEQNSPVADAQAIGRYDVCQSLDVAGQVIAHSLDFRHHAAIARVAVEAQVLGAIQRDARERLLVMQDK